VTNTGLYMLVTINVLSLDAMTDISYKIIQDLNLVTWCCNGCPIGAMCVLIPLVVSCKVVCNIIQVMLQLSPPSRIISFHPLMYHGDL
jgi:hypothetical protein